MRYLLGLCGFCLVGFAAGAYFLDSKAGACLFLGIAGIGLILDSLIKDRP